MLELSDMHLYDGNQMIEGVINHICSACNASCGKPYKVCPSCGASMKKAKYDPSWVDEAEGLSALLDDDW